VAGVVCADEVDARGGKEGRRTSEGGDVLNHEVDGVRLHYEERGSGVPLVALHGAAVDHRDIAIAIEGIVPSSYLRIYPDLPGMGRSTSDGLTCNDDVVTVLVDFIDRLGAGPVMLVGHSYGAYLARGVAARRPDLVLGLALMCPIGQQTQDVPPHEVVHQDNDVYDQLSPAQRAKFDDYFVVRTAANARRFRDHTWPGISLVDEEALGRIFAGWTIDVGYGTFSAPTLIVAGRRDSVVGYTDAMRLSDQYPRATIAVIDDAGHALMHERPGLLGALVSDWLARR
jgi:pimeloyl-ACP methyl ester carboxylesterase